MVIENYFINRKKMSRLISDIGVLEDKMKSDNLPTYNKQFDNQIYSVHFSPFEWSHDILCIAFAKKICIAQVKFLVHVCMLLLR